MGRAGLRARRCQHIRVSDDARQIPVSLRVRGTFADAVAAVEAGESRARAWIDEYGTTSDLWTPMSEGRLPVRSGEPKADTLTYRNHGMGGQFGRHHDVAARSHPVRGLDDQAAALVLLCHKS